MKGLPEGAVRLGVIKIAYWIAPSGETMISAKLPEYEDVPYIVQLGMIEATKETINRKAHGK